MQVKKKGREGGNRHRHVRNGRGQVYTQKARSNLGKKRSKADDFLEEKKEPTPYQTVGLVRGMQHDKLL